MISADFYQTAQTFSNPTTEVTNYIPSVDSALSNAYWLGWINYDNIPDCCKMSNVTITNTELILTNDGTVTRNYSIGYFCEPVSGGYSGSYSSAYTVLNSSVNSASGYNKRYINKMDVMGIGASNIRIYYDVFVRYGTGGELTNIARSLDKPLNIALTFFIGDGTINITAPTIAVTFEISASTQADEGYWFFSGNNGTYDYECYIYIKNVQIYPAIARQSTGASGGYTPLVGIGLETETDNGTIVYQDLSSSCVYSSIGRYAIALANNFDFDNTSSRVMYNNYIVSGFNCRFNRQQLLANTLYFYFDGNSCAYRYNANIFYIARVLTISEIVKLLSLYIRWDYGTVTANHYGYVADEIYAPYITEDNEFTATLITGNLSDDEFKAKLRPWQYDVDEWAENDYTEEDLPPYEPEGDDNPTTSGGDDHLPRRGFSIGGTGGFVTQYALSYSQLHEFANMLWAQFGDADFISNIGTTFLNDYSIKPSDILNYIVSMRVYPFNLADSVSYTDTQSANIFIGRGVFPYILTTGNTHVIADTCETFDGGYCDVPTYYNDFRDYEPASSIEVYVPFCGSVSISPSEVVGKRLRLTYGVDYSTGALSATLWVISDTNYTLAVLSGQVAASIQMSASNEMDGILRLTSIATTIGKAMLTEDKIDASKMSDTAKHVSNATNALGMASDLVNSVGSGLPVHSIGNTNGFSNFATPPRACVTITYHKYKNPQNFAHVYGYKCNRRETLSSLNGYTKCKNVDVSGFTCHEDERSEIKALLESGVYL